MTAERDRLAALIREADETVSGQNDWYGKIADRLITAGAFDLDVERLARALERFYQKAPGAMNGSAAAIAAAYREDAGG